MTQQFDSKSVGTLLPQCSILGEIAANVTFYFANAIQRAGGKLTVEQARDGGGLQFGQFQLTE